uniref:Ig-like domain-containing protein n=1 Tax=Ailuropoda melanoleuca TaxID=9646 RepID=A0A7N5P4H9_AILME
MSNQGLLLSLTPRLSHLTAVPLAGGWAWNTLEQPIMVVAPAGSSATLPSNTKVSYIHWYQHQEGNAPQRLLIVALFSSYVQTDSVLKGDKVTARRGSDGKSCNLLMSKLEKSDEGVYYCAAWEAHSPACLPGPSTKRSLTPWAMRGWHLSLALGPWGCSGVSPQHPGLSLTPPPQVHCTEPWRPRELSCLEGLL